MFISAGKLTDEEKYKNYYFNPDKIISISPDAFEVGYSSTVYFVDGYAEDILKEIVNEFRED